MNTQDNKENQKHNMVSPKMMSYNQPMSVAFMPIIAAPFRLTHSDVMCTTITSKPRNWDALAMKRNKQKEPSSSLSKKSFGNGVTQCHLPYMEKSLLKNKNKRLSKSNHLKQSGNTGNFKSLAVRKNTLSMQEQLLQKQHQKQREVRRKKMLQEYHIFMSNLQKERTERRDLENEAAKKIQLFYRNQIVETGKFKECEGVAAKYYRYDYENPNDIEEFLLEHMISPDQNDGKLLTLDDLPSELFLS